MKILKKHLAVLALTICLAFASPMLFAQASDMTTTTRSTDTDDDSGKWGLAGLIGLVGLLGLKNKDRDTTTTRSTTTGGNPLR